MKTYIILLAIDTFDRRKNAERIENEKFDSIKMLYELLQKDIDDEITDKDVLIFELTDFMDACNNEELELSLWWVTYVNIEDNMDGKGAGFQGSGNDIKSDGLSGFRG